MNVPRSGEVLVHGLKLSYLEWGAPRDGVPSILCFHGLLATGESFTRLAGRFDPSKHIIALDLPGNGGSDTRTELDVSFAGLAQIAGAFADAVGLRNLVVLGHSHGGALALRLAVSRPDLVKAAVLLCPAHPFSGQEEKLVRFYLSFPGRLVAHAIPHLPGAIRRRSFRQMLGSAYSGDERWFESYERNLRRRGVVSHILRLLKSWREDMGSLRCALTARKLALPVLLIWGGDDPVVPVSTARALCAALDCAEIAVLPGIGHLPNEEDPKLCSEVVLNWLARLP